jgi:RNA polymerase sigma factor (sigma-70 family)
MNASNAAGVRAPLPLVTDRQIARLAARGESRAFAALYERYQQELYRYCHSILGNGEDALDALHNTMAQALRSLPGEEREIALRPWLYRVAHNESISLLRDRRAHSELDEAKQVESPGIEQQTAIRAEFRQLTADLGQLADRQRSALVMRELSGLAYGEIGAALGTSEAGAKQTVYEARVALQALAEGRDMECEAVQRSVSDGDGRLLRARRVRSHLRSCSSCRAFSDAIGSRRAQLAALAPSLPMVGAAALLQGLLGGGAQGTAGGGGGLMAGIFGGSAAKIATGSAVKIAVVGAITVGAGVELATTTDVVGGGGESPAVEGALAPGSAASATAAQQQLIEPPVRAEGSISGDGRPSHGEPAGDHERLAGSSGLAGKDHGEALGHLPGSPAEGPGLGEAKGGEAASPPAHSSAGGDGRSSPSPGAHGKTADAKGKAAPAEREEAGAAPGRSDAATPAPGQLKQEEHERPNQGLGVEVAPPTPGEPDWP